MADSKITALTAISTVDPTADPLVIVDVSDTSMAASGTTKKSTINQLLGSGGTATLASATITGDLTVDTNVLKVDSAGNRVSVNTTTFATDSAFAVKTTAGKFDVRAAGSLSIKLNSDQSMLYNVPTGNSHLFQINDSDAMTLNSTGLGVGITSPSYRLEVRDTADAVIALVKTGANSLRFLSTSSGGVINQVDNNPLAFYTNNTERARIDSSGNFGIGVTPSAWNSNYNALDIGQNGTISGRAGSSNTVDLASNGFRNTSGNWVYKLATSNTACRYQLDGSTGSHIWYSGAAGTAGNTIAGFSSALMTLDASGNLILQPPSSPPTLGTNGQLTVNATSNTNLRFSYRGSDGVTRVANITLA